MLNPNRLSINHNHSANHNQPFQLPYRSLIAIFAIGFVSTGTTHAGTTLEMVGNPTFKPTDFAFGTATLDTNFTNAKEFFRADDEWLSRILGDSHFLAHDSKVEFPGAGPLFPNSEHGDFDNGLRRAMAGDGGILTDVVTASQFRGRRFYSLNYNLVPFNNAPLGNSLNGTNVPVISNDIFPFTYNVTTYQDGVNLNNDEDTVLNDPQPFEPLASYGIVTDEQGGSHDFTDLHWDHKIVRGKWGNGPNRSTADMVGEWEREVEIRDKNGNGWNITTVWDVVARRSRLDGDLSHNDELDMHDLEILVQNVAVGATNSLLDMNEDDLVDHNDVRYWVNILKNTWIGDANLDGEFNSSDLVNVFQVGKYETGEMALWSEGDWNADERFDSSDFVVAFQDGGYEAGHWHDGIATVPEPSSWLLAFPCIAAAIRFRRKR